jgi:hypothetical protein
MIFFLLEETDSTNREEKMKYKISTYQMSLRFRSLSCSAIVAARTVILTKKIAVIVSIQTIITM